jgi:hypothetical protein
MKVLQLSHSRSTLKTYVHEIFANLDDDRTVVRVSEEEVRPLHMNSTHLCFHLTSGSWTKALLFVRRR